MNNIKILITLIGVFAFCVAYKFFSNHIRQQKAMALKKKYIDWVTNEDSVPDMETYQYDIIELFKAAKVKNVRLSLSSRGMHKDIDIALFDNLLQRRTGIIREVLDAFDFAIGYYRSSKRKAISPLYWIESIIFLPKKIIEYIGADLEKTACDILPHLKRRGLPLARASSRFSFEQSSDYSISELSPCVPRFLSCLQN